MTEQHYEIAEVYGYQWETLCGEELKYLFDSNTTLVLPSSEEVTSISELLSIHEEYYQKIKSIPLSKLYATKEYQGRSRPGEEIYDVKIFAPKDDLVFFLRISTTYRGTVSKIILIEDQSFLIGKLYSPSTTEFSADKEVHSENE